jgi:hypothetical protein
MGEHAPSYRRILATLGELIEDVDGSSSNAFWRGWKHRDFDSFHERPLLALACLRNEARCRGSSLPTASGATVLERLGFDRRPLDARDEDDVRWLRACVSPGEVGRIRTLDAALAAFPRVAPQPRSTAGTASTVTARLRRSCAALPDRRLLIVYQTLVSGYLQTAERESYERGMRQFSQSAAPGSALWLQLEVGDESDPVAPASLRVHLGVEGTLRTLDLARTSYHPVALTIAADAVGQFERGTRI